jgi:hypothetical protein
MNSYVYILTDVMECADVRCVMRAMARASWRNHVDGRRMFLVKTFDLESSTVLRLVMIAFPDS